MNANQLLADLQAQDIKITINKGKLRIDAPKGALIPSLETQLRLHKQELLDLLAPAQLPGLAAPITPAPVKPESDDDSNPQRGLPGACVYIASEAAEPECTQGYKKLWANMMVLEAISLGGIVA